MLSHDVISVIFRVPGCIPRRSGLIASWPYAAILEVDGVISQIIRYCVPYAHDFPLLNDKLKAAKIPRPQS